MIAVATIVVAAAVGVAAVTSAAATTMRTSLIPRATECLLGRRRDGDVPPTGRRQAGPALGIGTPSYTRRSTRLVVETAVWATTVGDHRDSSVGHQRLVFPVG